MEEVSSSTDISSSLSEFIRKERILKELYQENKTCVKPAEVHLNRNDKEIDSILQQMGRLLSPAGEELDNKVYKHVIAETENKSIEQILNEAKELINENVTVGENESIYISNDDLSSECLDKEINSLDVRNIYNSNNVNGKEENASSSDEELQIQLETNKTLKKETSRNEKKKNLRTKKEVNNSPKKINTNKNKLLSKDHKLYEKMNYFRNEFFRIKSIYDLSKQENENLTENIQKLKL